MKIKNRNVPIFLPRWTERSPDTKRAGSPGRRAADGRNTPERSMADPLTSVLEAYALPFGHDSDIINGLEPPDPGIENCG